MRPVSLAKSFFRSIFRRRQVDADLDDEIASTLELLADEKIKEGVPAAKARRAARIELGGVEQVKEAVRSGRTTAWLDAFVQDLRFALRMLRKSPGFTTVAVLTLALGIGATTSVYSVVSAVVLRPLPYKAPNQLVSIWQTGSRASQMPVTYPDFLDWRAQNHVFKAIAAYNWSPFMLLGPKEPAHVEGYAVSANLFSLLGVAPELGRGFVTADDEPGHHVVLLSHELWQQEFGSSPKVLGSGIRLDRTIFTVVGVMPASFQFPIGSKPTGVWVTQGVQDLGSQDSGRGSHEYEIVARLRPGVTLRQARAEMATIAARLARQYPDFNEGEGVKIVPEQQELVGHVQGAILILFGAVVLVLLIACANVASLLIARATNREREIAIRGALGAGRRRIVRQLLTESLLLAALGGGIGMLLAFAGTGFLAHLGPSDIPRLTDAGVNWPVLAFGSAVAVITGLLFGLGPALKCGGVQVNESIKAGGLSSGGSCRRHGVRAALVAGEVALTVLLLSGAGLMLNSFFRLISVNPGFNAKGVLTFSVDFSDTDVTPLHVPGLYDDLLAKIRQTPGVRSAAADTTLPLGGTQNIYVGFQLEGQNKSEWDSAALSIVSPGVFHTLEIPLIEGREFTVRDDQTSPPVVIVSQKLARYFPHLDALGKLIRTGLNAGNDMPLRRIVGIVGDIRRDSLTDNPPAAIYMPEGQMPTGMSFLVRSAASPASAASGIRAAIHSVDGNLAVYDIRTLDQYLGLATAGSRFNTTILALFAVLAMVLSAVGLYGVISYTVAQRTHEFGIRVALGASRRDLLGMVLRRGLVLVLTGMGIGLLGALQLTRFLSRLLYNVKPRDPLTFIIVSLILVSVALLACYVPARRAMRVDPMAALRHE
jgi:predicted permease